MNVQISTSTFDGVWPMALAVIGSILNLAVALGYLAIGDLPVLGLILVAPAGLSIVGLLVAASGGRKWGSYLIIAGAVFFIPLGIIAAIGGSQVLSSYREDKFEAEHSLDD